MVLEHHLLPVFGDTPLDQIDVRAVDAYKVAKLEHPGPRGHVLNPNTINKHIKLLARILRVAKRWKLITEVPELSKLKPRKVDFDFLGFDEAEQFIAGAREHVPQWHPFIVVAMRTGLRHGELAALRWREDLDLERGRIRVQRSYNPLNGFTSTKNEKVRELPLTWDALAMLKTQRQRVDASCELVFPRPTGEVISANQTNGVLKKLTTALGMRHVHNHMLRHTFASHAASVPPSERIWRAARAPLMHDGCPTKTPLPAPPRSSTASTSPGRASPISRTSPIVTASPWRCSSTASDI